MLEFWIVAEKATTIAQAKQVVLKLQMSPRRRDVMVRELQMCPKQQNEIERI
jgi:hypothetical protein